MTTDAPSKTNTSERRRGYQEARQKIELLRTKWPQAFPAKAHAVRPLTNGAQQAIIEAFGWSAAYARAVLSVWKLGPAYCNAILRYPTRINLDGSPSDEEIDDRSRAAATARLEQRAAWKAREQAKAERLKLQVTAMDGRVVRRVEELDDATLKAIERSVVPPEHAAPDSLLKDWNP